MEATSSTVPVVMMNVVDIVAIEIVVGDEHELRKRHRTEEAYRAPANEAVTPIPVDPGRPPHEPRHPNPAERCPRPPAIVEGEAPGLGRIPGPATGTPGPRAVGI